MYLPTLSSAFQVKSMDRYWLTTIGDVDSGLFVQIVFKAGEIHDSYLVVGGEHQSHVSFDYVKAPATV